MCGIIGYSGKKNFNSRYIDVTILWNSLERGEDATGIFSPKNGIKKSLTKGSHYILYAKNQLIPDNYLIAHVRAATVGAKTDVNNAHPFERGNFILAHNGTLTNHKDLASKYELPSTEYAVDSDIVAGCIDKADDISTVLKEINGPAAFLIHDKRNPELLYAFTNGERPLFRGIDNLGNMYISSLEETMYFLGLTSVKEFKENTLYTIKNGTITHTRKIKNIPYIKPVTPTVNTHTGYNTHSTSIDFWKFCTLRSMYSTAFMYGQKYIEIRKDSYYHCEGVQENNDKMVRVDYEGEKILLPKIYLNHEDVVYTGDFLKVKEDVLDPSSLNGAFKAKKGDIVVATQIYMDGDVSTRFHDSPKAALGYLPKTHFVKLTEEEKAALYSNKPDINSLEEGLAADIIALREDEENNTNRPNDAGLSDQIVVDEGMLDKFFEEIDDKLESLNSKLATEDTASLRLEIVGLLDYVFIAKNNLLMPTIK